MNGVKKLAYGVVFAVAALGAASAWATSDYYVGVEYIGSDGNQYIDTIWTNGSSHVVTLNIQPTAVPTTDGSGAGGSMTYYGCRTSYQSQNITMFIDFANNTPSFNLDFNNGDYSTYRHIAGNVSTDYRYVLVNSAAERTVTAYDASGDVVDSSSDDDNCAATFSCAGSAYLFAINDMSGGSPAFLWTNKAKMKFYGATVDTVGGEQCCNLVPCLKNGSEPGVYDTVRDLFLTNSGSGSFTYGAATGIVYGDDPGGDTPAPAGRLPAGYEEVTSIIVTDVRQYIDTGYKPNVTTDVEGHFYVPNFNDTTTLYWTRLGSAYNYCAYGFVFPANADTLGKIRVYRFSAGTAQTDFPSDSITHDIWISTEYSNGGTVNSYTLNEHTLNFAAKAIDSIDYSIYLFRLNDVGTVNVNAVVGMKLYSFKILENRVPVKDFVPCRRASDGAVGLYDVLEEDKRKAFYKNPTGTGGNFDYEILTPGPVLDPPEISNLTSTNALVSGSVSSFGAGATSADVRFVYTDGATTNSVAIGTATSAKLVGGLASATDFTCWFTATNNASVPVAADSAAVSFRTRTLPTGGQHAVGLYFPRAPEAALADFPVLVRVSEDNVDGFSYAYCPTATNIWFTDANDEALPFDVDTWNPAGESLFWVSVQSFSSSATVTLHWSDDISDAPASPASSQVWSRANYVGVWHMNELVYDPVKEKHYTPDASASGWNAYKVTQSDAVPAPVTNATGVTANPTPPTGTAMNIAYGAGKDNTSYGGFCVPMAQTASFTLGGSGFTLSGIVNSQQKANNGRCRVIAFGDAYNDMANFAVGSDSIYCMAGTQTSISWDHTKGSTDWVFAADVFSTTSQIYSDGIPRHPGNSNVNLTGITLSKGIGLGCFINGKNTVDGYIDEARIRNAVSSAAWIAAEYATVTDPDYVSFGAAPAPAVLPAGFTQCSYIVVTNRNQYINTRCAPGLSTDIQAHFEVPDFSTQNVLYWARNSQTIDHGFILEANADSTKKVRAYRLSNGKNTNVTQLQNQPVKTEMFLSTEYRDMTHNTFTLNGETARFVQWEVESDPAPSVTFVNTFDWEEVYFYAMDENGDSVTGDYPGTLMSRSGNSNEYFIDVPTTAKTCCFARNRNAEEVTEDVEVRLGAKYTPKYKDSSGYYKLDIEQLSSKSIRVGDKAFEFGLYKCDDYHYNNERLIQRKFCDSNGDVTFDELTYTVGGDYYYLIREIEPDEKDSDVDTYSKQEFHVKVKAVANQPSEIHYYSDNGYQISTEYPVFNNKIKVGKINVNKSDNLGSKVEGVIFEVYKVNGYGDTNFYDFNRVGKDKTDSDGKAASENLPIYTSGYKYQTNNSAVVTFNNTKSWSNVYIYIADSRGRSLINDWPGTQMDSIGNGKYQFEVPLEASIIVFNDGQSNETVEISPKKGAVYTPTVMQAGYWNLDSSLEIYFDNSKNWSNVKLFAANKNGDPINGDWPGNNMESVDGTLYKATLPATVDYIVFNEGNSTSSEDVINVFGDAVYTPTDFENGVWKIETSSKTESNMHSQSDYQWYALVEVNPKNNPDTNQNYNPNNQINWFQFPKLGEDNELHYEYTFGYSNVLLKNPDTSGVGMLAVKLTGLGIVILSGCLFATLSYVRIRRRKKRAVHLRTK